MGALWRKIEQSFLENGVCIKKMGRPLKGRNIPGCSAVISRRLHFRVLYGINQFQIQFARIWNRYKLESSGFFSTLLWRPVWKPISFIWNRFIPESTRNCRWSEIFRLWNIPGCSNPWEGDPMIPHCKPFWSDARKVFSCLADGWLVNGNLVSYLRRLSIRSPSMRPCLDSDWQWYDQFWKLDTS